MCGRFTLTWPSYAELSRLLGVAPTDALSLLYRPRWNVAPTDAHWVVRLPSEGGPREIVQASWGLTPLPSSTGARRGPLINARCETAARMPGVRGAFAGRRCVVPVDGFYEWVGPGSPGVDARSKRPIWFSSAEGELLRFAGLWEPDDGPLGARFTILTTAANDVVAPVHDRMPVIIGAGDVDAWLGGAPAEAAGLMRAAPRALLAARAVVPRANSVKNDDPACLDPWDPTLEVELAGEGRRAADKPAPPVRRRTSGAGSKNTTLPMFEGDDVSAPARKRKAVASVKQGR